MNDLRTAAQQALEALGSSQYPQPRQMAAITALRDALAQQAEPLNLSDHAVRKRLASQWGYVPAAAQAEPVEPYCYVYEYDGVFGLHREFYPLPYNGMKPSRTVPVYTAPPQRKPLTEEIQLEVEAEREECAQIADAEASIEGIAQRIAAAIRARGEKT